jgi:hypothetical protein
VHLADLAVGQPLAQRLDEILNRVTLVLLVIDDAPFPPSIMFEAGLAHARVIPVAVLDSRSPKPQGTTDDLALDTLLPGPRLYAHLFDEIGIAEQLDAYLQLLPSREDTAPPEAVTPSRRRLFQKPLGYETEGEQRTSEGLMGLGAVVLADRAGSRSLPDLVVRFPQLELSMNPVLVEVKGRKAHLGQARQQLRDALSRSDARLGLLVTLDSLPEAAERVGPGQVLAQISLLTLEQMPERLIGLLFDGVTLLVECKNEERPISSAEVRIFGTKLGERNQPVGVMISRAGLSGRSRNKTAGHGTVGLELATRPHDRRPHPRRPRGPLRRQSARQSLHRATVRARGISHIQQHLMPWARS